MVEDSFYSSTWEAEARKTSEFKAILASIASTQPVRVNMVRPYLKTLSK